LVRCRALELPTATHLITTSRRAALIGTAALQATAASTIGLSVSALTPSAETALAVGPVVMILSLMLADTGGMFAPVPAFLRPLSHLSVRVQLPWSRMHPSALTSWSTASPKHF
jgi:hypothetical protein